MAWLYKGMSYCRQLATRQSLTCQTKSVYVGQSSPVLCSSVQWSRFKATGEHEAEESVRNLEPTYKFKVKSPYRNPGPRLYGYKQQYYDGGALPRGLSTPIVSKETYRPKNRWDEKHALFGRNDCIDLMSDSDMTPVDLIKAPAWLKGFNGNELQRITRRMKFEGHKLRQLYPTYYTQNIRRIQYLYKKYNQKRGKRHK